MMIIILTAVVGELKSRIYRVRPCCVSKITFSYCSLRGLLTSLISKRVDKVAPAAAHSKQKLISGAASFLSS
eukprot:scaffold22725_cov100-Skeletonema_dohrnii-CCMP3373.AAC.1